MRFKLGELDPIMVDEEKLRRRGPRRAIDVRRGASRKDALTGLRDIVKTAGDDAISVDVEESLAALIALARRRSSR